MIARSPQRRLQPSRQRMFHLPAPIGGMNSVSPGTDMPVSDCIYAYNLIGAEFGLRSRLGWREWCTELAGEQVRSLLPYTGSTKDGASNRLFACTASGIWDVSSSMVGPSRVVTFSVQDDDSGWGISTAFVNAAGHFLAYTDEANGYYLYAESTATWTAGGLPGNPITGVDPLRLSAVVPWKNRLWFVERDTANGWYLAIGAVTGPAVKFTFGQRFKAGGDLRILASWTFDGGSGIDDRLVAVSGGGDVVIYQGTDPASASTFGLQGVWFVGAVPSGRRLCTDFGGDLLLMSSIGIMPLSKLVTGNIVYDRSQYQTAKVANTFNQMQAATGQFRGWAMRLHPQDAALLVLAPVALNQPTQQLAMSLVTRGWSTYRDMPMGVCAEPWNGSLYFGTDDGRVCVNDGDVDGALLADPNAYSAIGWSLLTAFSNMGSPRIKRLHQIAVRTLSRGGSAPLSAEARYGFDLREAGTPEAVVPGSDAWGSAVWGSAVWGGDSQAMRRVFGAAGMAPEMALAVRGSATARTTIIGFDVAYDECGSML